MQPQGGLWLCPGLRPVQSQQMKGKVDREGAAKAPIVGPKSE